MAHCVPGRLEVKLDWALGQCVSGVVERCFCGVGTKSEIAACRARYFFFLDAEFFKEGLFLLEIVNCLAFCFFLLLSGEVFLPDLAAELFDFLLFRLGWETFEFFFVEGVGWALLVFFDEDLLIVCWRRATVF
jgi:hypothetical protein